MTLLVKSRQCSFHVIGVHFTSGMIAVFLPSNVECKITFPRVFDLTNRVGHGTV
jgi:hypothetical protein